MSSMNDEISQADPSIIVVGAGMAGLASAAKLAANNFENVVVLEARNRIGGRVSTVSLGDAFIEDGATWIHGERENPLFELINEAEIQTTDWDYIEVMKHGLWLKENEGPAPEDEVKILSDAFITHYDLVDGIAIHPKDNEIPNNEPKNVKTFLEKEWQTKILQKHSSTSFTLLQSALRIIEQLECANFGMENLSLCPLSFFDDIDSMDRSDSILCDGYDKIFRPLLRKLSQNSIRLNSVVKRIEWNRPPSTDGTTIPTRRRVCVTYENEQGMSKQLYADHVIVTIPLGCLKKYHEDLFSPSLPQEKLQAMERLSFDTINKVVLMYDEPFWPVGTESMFLLWSKESLQTCDDWTRDFCQMNIRTNEQNNLHWLETWFCGKSALEVEKHSENEIGRKLTSILRRFVGDDMQVPEPNRVHYSKWGSDPHSLGSYSCTTVFGSGEDIEVMAKPLPFQEDVKSNNETLQLLFAGECTSRDAYGFVHGAFATGEREAERIASYYACDKSENTQSTISVQH